MESLTLEQAYYIGELFGTIAVVISLIFVGLQIRQNSRAIQVTTSQAFVKTWIDHVSNINQSPELANCLRRGMKDWFSLDDGETVQFSAFYSQAFVAYQSFYYEWRRGLLDNDLWATYRHTMADSLSCAGICQWWEHRQHWFSLEFQTYVNEIASKESIQPMYPDREID